MDGTQLAQIERLCTTLYSSPNEAERVHAQQQVLVLQSSADYIPQCQYVLDNSKVPFALLVASNSLTKLITTHWNNFSVPQRIDIRNYILNYLAQKGPLMEKFVNVSLIQLVCRISKLGWFDDDQHRKITQEVSKFLQATVEHCLIGLQILIELVNEMNQPTSGRTLAQHRKTAVSFRDESLYQIFQVSLTTLRQLQLRTVVTADKSQENKMTELSLDLAVKCLSFDFIGTNPDESAEDIGAIQVPSTWRPLIQEPATMDMLFQAYQQSEPPNSAKALEVLLLLSSCRRSLFSTDKELSRFLAQLLSGTREILSKQVGLSDPANYHEFCRLLGRLKTNYQLSELVKTDGYREWMDLAASFTVNSFQQWQVVQAYVQSRIDSVDMVLQNEAFEDPLEDEGNLKEQLERLPTIVRHQYETIGQYLVSLFDPLLRQYKDILQVNPAPSDQPTAAKLQSLEGKMTWLTYFVGAVIGGHAWASSQVRDGDESVDADLSRRTFELMRIVEYRATSTRGQSRCDTKLELALLFYFHAFRRSYIGEQHGMPSQSTDITALSGKQRAYQRMFERMGLGDHIVVVNMIVTKIGNNLKYWAEEEEIIGKTLELFWEIASGYGSGKLLLSLDTVQYLMQHHTAEDFPFLSYPANTRHRTLFYSTLTKILLSSIDDSLERFDIFVQPILNTLAQLQQTPNFRTDSVKQAITGVCRDLRGITSSTHNRKTYGCLFEYLYPAYFPVFVRAGKECYDDPSVITALLQFMNEFAYNKSHRVVFDQSSPNGILLFREISETIVAYGRQVVNYQPRSDLYRNKYKGIRLTLAVLSRALAGGYVNFGVFALYNDKALDNALEIALQLALSVPLQELMTYPKLTKAYFSFLEILFRNHVPFVIMLDTPIFMQLINSLHEGLNSLDSTLCTQCASAVDYLATYHFSNSSKDTPIMRKMKLHLSANPGLLTALLSTLFNIILFGETNIQWSLSRPILSITLASEEAFQQCKQQLIMTQSPQNQARLEEAFSKLFVDVRRNLEVNNRDKFTQKMTPFRVTVRGFLTG